MSGSRVIRDGLQLLRVGVEEGHLIMVKKLDRFCRDTVGMIKVKKKIDNMGVAIRLQSASVF